MNRRRRSWYNAACVCVHYLNDVCMRIGKYMQECLTHLCTHVLVRILVCVCVCVCVCLCKVGARVRGDGAHAAAYIWIIGCNDREQLV